MRGLLGAYRGEWLRLATGRSVWLLPLSAVLAGAYALSLGVAAERGLFGTPNGFYLAAAGATGAAITAAAVGALFAASAVGTDFASGVARTALCRPVGRTAWWTARLLALASALALAYLAGALGALMAGWARFGLTVATEGSYLLASRGLLFTQLGVAVATSLLGLAVAVAVGGLWGMGLGRPGPAVAATALLGAVVLALGRWPRLEPLLATTSLTAGLDRVAQLSQGLASRHATDVAPRALLVFLARLVGALGTGALVLGRKDIST